MFFRVKIPRISKGTVKTELKECRMLGFFQRNTYLMGLGMCYIHSYIK